MRRLHPEPEPGDGEKQCGQQKQGAAEHVKIRRGDPGGFFPDEPEGFVAQEFSEQEKSGEGVDQQGDDKQADEIPPRRPREKADVDGCEKGGDEAVVNDLAEECRMFQNRAVFKSYQSHLFG